MGKTTSKKTSVKTSSENPLVNPPPGDKTLGLDPEIRFYTLEDGDDTVEGEETEICLVYDSTLTVYRQNLIKRKFPYIDTFNHEIPAVVNNMLDLTRGVFEHLEINSSIYMDQRITYMQVILGGDSL